MLSKMSDLVFENKPALDLLSQIVHAKVQDESERRVKELTEAGIKAVVLDFDPRQTRIPRAGLRGLRLGRRRHPRQRLKTAV